MANRRQFVQSAASLAALSALPAALRAQGFGQVKINNGFPAGGTADATARRVACEVVKASKPDGTTLLLTPYSMMSIYPHIYARLSYDPFKDFAPVSIAAVMTHALSVGPMVPASVTTFTAES